MKHEYEKLKVDMEEKEKEVMIVLIMSNNSSKRCGVSQFLRQLISHPRWNPFVCSWTKKRKRLLKNDRN